jgi:hypothetical protein
VTVVYKIQINQNRPKAMAAKDKVNAAVFTSFRFACILTRIFSSVATVVTAASLEAGI